MNLDGTTEPNVTYHAVKLHTASRFDQYEREDAGLIRRALVPGPTPAAPSMYNKLINNPGVAAKAQANLDRLGEFGLTGVRPDYEKLLKIVAKDNLKGLLQKVAKGGAGALGLPAAMAAYTDDGLGAIKAVITPNPPARPVQTARHQTC